MVVFSSVSVVNIRILQMSAVVKHEQSQDQHAKMKKKNKTKWTNNIIITVVQNSTSQNHHETRMRVTRENKNA